MLIVNASLRGREAPETISFLDCLPDCMETNVRQAGFAIARRSDFFNSLHATCPKIH